MEINTATKITIVRIILIPIILLVLVYPYDKFLSISILGLKIYLPYFIALIFFIIASLSDALDGYIARKTKTITNLGKFLDPVADKLLVNSVLIYFASTNHLPVITVILMISRDIIVDALRMICIENDVVIAASNYGKLKTILQMITLCLVLLLAIPDKVLPFEIIFLVYVTTIVSVASGFDYFIKNINFLKK